MTQAAVPAGIDFAAVSRFFAAHVPGGDVPLTITLISGGRSNLTYLVSGGGQRWVLRRPPLGHVLPTAHDMAREFKVLSGIHGTGVPAPTPIALCEDAAVNGASFYVMDYREGVIVGEDLPPGFATTIGERRRMAEALVDNLVRLHAVDYNAVGLGDFGRPEGYLERQVRRWSEQWERSRVDGLPAIDELIRRLRTCVPPSPAPTIVHGDYRFGNMVLDPADPGHVIAILDWEMATLGDPLTDLAWTLCYYGEEGDSAELIAANATGAVTAKPGFPPRAWVASEYGRRSGRNVENLEFYIVFAWYKLSVIAAGIWVRFLKGETVGEGFETMGDRLAAVANAGIAAADAAADPRLRGAR